MGCDALGWQCDASPPCFEASWGALAEHLAPKKPGQRAREENNHLKYCSTKIRIACSQVLQNKLLCLGPTVFALCLTAPTPLVHSPTSPTYAGRSPVTRILMPFPSLHKLPLFAAYTWCAGPPRGSCHHAGQHHRGDRHQEWGAVPRGGRGRGGPGAFPGPQLHNQRGEQHNHASRVNRRLRRLRTCSIGRRLAQPHPLVPSPCAAVGHISGPRCPTTALHELPRVPAQQTVRSFGVLRSGCDYNVRGTEAGLVCAPSVLRACFLTPLLNRFPRS